MEKLQFLVNEFKKHAKDEYPNECCGIVTKDFNYIRCSNISPDPINSFILDPEKMIEYEDECWGIFHSHPDDEPTPSSLDGKKIACEDFKYLVGWEDDIYLYWYDNSLNCTLFKTFDESCLK